MQRSFNGISLTNSKNKGVDDAFKQLLWDMTGTGRTKDNLSQHVPRYRNFTQPLIQNPTGVVCFGKTLQRKIQTFLTTLNDTGQVHD